MWLLIILSGALLPTSDSGAAVAACSERWKAEELVARLYLRLNTWEENETYHFYDVDSTFILLNRGASFARLPSDEERQRMHPGVWSQLFEMMGALGGYPERCGICVGAMDTVTKGSEHRFRLGSRARSDALNNDITFHVEKWLPPGKYCHHLALDRREWDDLHVSRLEIRESFARQVASGKRVMVFRGGAHHDADKDLQLPLRFAISVSVLPLPSSMTVDILSSIVEQLGSLLVGIDLLLLVQLPIGVGALLSMLASCTHRIQALDVGDLALIASEQRVSLAPLHTVSWQGQVVSASSFAIEPRPQFLRPGAGRLDLNGLWEVLIASEDTPLESLPVAAWNEVISVPFAPQSYRGLATKVSSNEAVWYRRKLEIPSAWCDSPAGVLYLHVDACDWECSLFVNRVEVGTHTGGYDPFSFELELSATAVCRKHGFELIVRAWDPTDDGCEFRDHPPIPCDGCCSTGWQPRGKQALKPGSIMYTGVTGLWRQGLWLEHVPQCHIRKLDLSVDSASVGVEAIVTCGVYFTVEVRPQGGVSIGKAGGTCCSLQVELSDLLRPWGPDDPAMYEVVVALGGGGDVVIKSFARRNLSVHEGHVNLNGQTIFMHGSLYQGYWPESLLTPPDPMAMENDLVGMRSVGFNTVRVHAVVMGSAFYAICDRLGLLVWQDMPAGDMRVMPAWSEDRGRAEDEFASAHLAVGRSIFDEIRRVPESQAAFDNELQAMVAWLEAFPSVVVWVVFNEGWGQSKTASTVERLRQLDPTRLINAVSGWNEVEGPPLGDFVDAHNYEDSSSPFGLLPETFDRLELYGIRSFGRVKALGEYGGLGFAVPDHAWTTDGAWGYGKEVRRETGLYLQDLEGVLSRLLPLICAGLGAAIYTQWNDVETEMNGLLTYDRYMKVPREAISEYSSTVMRVSTLCSTTP